MSWRSKEMNRSKDEVAIEKCSWTNNKVITAYIILLYILEYKCTLSIRQMVFYLGKTGIVPDSFILWATQIMDRQAQFFPWRKYKTLQPKTLPRSMHWLFCYYCGKTDLISPAWTKILTGSIKQNRRNKHINCWNFLFMDK